MVDMDIQERFWPLVDTQGDCWLWLGSHHPSGYGILGVVGKIYSVHRLSWQIANGPIPDGLQVCHHCDVRDCVRPSHLFLGTASDNRKDMVAKGRQGRGWHPARRGEVHQAAKLSDVEVGAIREAVELGGETQRDIAKRFGISHTYVGMLARKEKRV